MNFLAHFRILTKLFGIILILGSVAGAITYLGISSLSSLNDATDQMEAAAGQALAAQQLTNNLLAVNRAEFRIAADPRAENYKEARQAIDQELAKFRERFDELNKNIIGAERAKLEAVRAKFEEYQRELQGTFRAAEAVKNFQMTDELMRLRDEAFSSRKLAEETRQLIATLAADLDNIVSDESKQATEEYLAASRLMLLLAGIGIALGVLAGFVVGQFGIVKPIRDLVAALQRLASGDYSLEVQGADRKDEVGEVARTARVFRENGLANQRMQQEQKDAEARAAAEKKQAMHQLAESFERAVGGIIGAVSSASSQLQGAAQTMSAAAEQTNRQSVAVASASEEASSNVQTVASAAEELATSVAEIGRRVNESAAIAAEAARDADATAQKVSRLSQAAQKIGDIVGLISTIAGQTNLLALNATIEAARAGEAGRGFAVVASEVKSLADQTAKATAEISAQIEEIQASTADSAHAIGQITEIIRRMNEIATTIASAVEEQGAATTEIARNVQQASAGTAEVSSNITGVTKAASDSSAASSQVLASAGDLATQSGVLQQEVAKFLATVRAA
ncbi:methyl-accepting chemotaxis protein [Blastochloris tepida]|uniref:Methyl-accepting chemotaxis protein n=1 Tax=Blastochloris tepida TaxID=2233851 RepID=A0A348FWY9_9HYPH|nr:methyl-accepting chemotaxis protein [Blastochloris tepida]BBF91822.1 methyl-accepting chemotaxis protein [Blastochloris tepida]